MRSFVREVLRRVPKNVPLITTIVSVAAALLVGAGEPHGQAPGLARSSIPADRPSPRADRNSMTAHLQLLEKAKRGGIDVYFIGDSIVRRWGATDYPTYLANWKENFFGWNAANFGWGADKTENMLWRLQNGELDGVNPKVIVILAGTNNVGTRPGGAAKVAEITRGLAAIVSMCRQKAPAATIILTGIFPSVSVTSMSTAGWRTGPACSSRA
jgi:GDSL-like lipase/acylhydrolase family protein